VKRFNILNPYSHQDYLQNIATKDLATRPIEESLINVQNLAKLDLNEYVSSRLLVEGGSRVAVHAPLKKNNPHTSTFTLLYKFQKSNKQKEKGKILQVDRTVLQRVLTAFEPGREVDMKSILKHELMPVPVAIAEMDKSFRTGNKSVLAECLTDGVHCPDSITLIRQRHL